jgi:MFS family permease
LNTAFNISIPPGFTFAGVWAVLTLYLTKNVPHEYLGTMLGIMHGVYWGLGSGTGFMVGGVLVQHFGARFTFWLFAGASAFNVIVFSIAQKVSRLGTIVYWHTKG